MLALTQSQQLQHQLQLLLRLLQEQQQLQQLQKQLKPLHKNQQLQQQVKVLSLSITTKKNCRKKLKLLQRLLAAQLLL